MFKFYIKQKKSYKLTRVSNILIKIINNAKCISFSNKREKILKYLFKKSELKLQFPIIYLSNFLVNYRNLKIFMQIFYIFDLTFKGKKSFN